MSEKNENLIIKNIDIATVEALHDNLLDLKQFKTTDKIHTRYLSLIKKMYALKDFQEEKIKSNLNKNILEEANDIIFNRAEEKQREYGPIDESLQDAAVVASIINNSNIDIEIVYAVLMGLKVSRMRWNKKHDTFLDAIGYMSAYEAYIRKTEKLNKKHKNE